MKKSTWHKLHKWTGLLLCFFMMMFCISGIILNHRHLYADVNISRGYLPSRYEFQNWNNGLLRGTLTIGDSVLIYGSGGIFLTNHAASSFKDFNNGLPESADRRNIRNLIQMPDGSLFACSRFGLLSRTPRTDWKASSLNAQIKGIVDSHTDLTDVTSRGDSLIVLSRSNVYVALPPYNQFKEPEIRTPAGHSDRVSLFRTFWVIHSGEIYGLPTKVISDLLGIILLFLSLTGFLFFAFSEHIKRLSKGRKVLIPISKNHISAALRCDNKWHNKIGRWTIILTLFITFTGWCLRPPMLIALVKNEVPAMPGSHLDTKNVWNDRLRMIRWDETLHEWILSTGDGFFALKTFQAVPQPLQNMPPVSVMGLNVFSKLDNSWILGSFSGIYQWFPSTGRYINIITGEVTEPTGTVTKAGPPIGNFTASGFSNDFRNGLVIVNYGEGTDVIPQPKEYNRLPMSLWNVALELHNGRLYPFCGGIGSMLFIFIIGIIALWCLWSGWKVRH